jgi:predicted nucleic acid-binding protein
MQLPYIDSNILIRYLTQDHPTHSALAAAIMERLEDGSLAATTCEAVLLEVVQVLSSKSLYHLPRQQVSAYLARFIRLKGLKFPHKRTYLRAFDLYASVNADFTDCLPFTETERQINGELTLGR